MTSSKTYFQWFAAFAAAAGLAGCGGYTTVELGGRVSGLVSEGLVLANGNDTVSVRPAADGSDVTYKFPNQIDAHGSYSVTVKSHPPHYTCVVSPSGTGKASGLPINYADVSCSKTTHTLGGTITGLTASGLKLTNGSDTLDVAANATTFTFLGRVAEQDVYGVAVLAQPTGQTCAVQNGTAVMGAADVTNVAVACVNN